MRLMSWEGGVSDFGFERMREEKKRERGKGGINDVLCCDFSQEVGVGKKGKKR